METTERPAMSREKKMKTAVAVLGTAGLLLILFSSLMPDRKGEDTSPRNDTAQLTDAEDYCRRTERQLEEFLSRIEGAGEVEVFLTADCGGSYVYATEGRRTKDDTRTEEERKYVMTGGGSERSPLIESVRQPCVKGAVVACTGCGDPAVQERIYRAVSAALGLPTGKIYVTLLR